jgi:hypothetical protein
MTRHIAGHIEISDQWDQPAPAPAQTFEIWDDNPDILVRLYLDGALVHEDSVRSSRKVSLDLSYGDGYARIDEGQDPASAREQALGLFYVPAKFLADLRLVGPNAKPAGTLYRGKPGTYIDRLVIDAATGFLALSKPLGGTGEPTMHFCYDLDEQVPAAPEPTALTNDDESVPDPRSETYDYDPAAVAAAFGLPTLPTLPGLTLDRAILFTTLGGTRQAHAIYIDAAKSEYTAQHIGEVLSAREAHEPQRMDYLMLARVAEADGYLDFMAPDLAGLTLIAAAFRPNLVL